MTPSNAPDQHVPVRRSALLFLLAACAAETAKESAGEARRIEALIAAVESSGVTFIRNGTPHDSAEAARHLRKKWKYAGGRDLTAEQFIERLASRSSLTGRPYEVGLADGTTRPAGDWLRAKLEELATR